MCHSYEDIKPSVIKLKVIVWYSFLFPKVQKVYKLTKKHKSYSRK